MAWRALAVGVLSLVVVAPSGLAQVRSGQELKAFVEGLRGRVSEATFENDLVLTIHLKPNQD